jgi:hypothetical protein
VHSASQLLQLGKHRAVAASLIGRGKGMQAFTSGQLSGIISAAAFSFIVQEPSGIMLRFSAMSRLRAGAGSASSRSHCGSD